MQNNRILSGMRPTGALHLGHYNGVLKNWLALQDSNECFLFVADWHAFTTHYNSKLSIEKYVFDMVTDWLCAGINPNSATIFIQSAIKEHAELHLLLSMSTPLAWLERVPSYKDMQANLVGKNLRTYGFLGYPLLQSADILIYKANQVPVGADQVAHVELTREIARHFNHIYGKEDNFEQKSQSAIKKMNKKAAKHYLEYRKAFQEQGDEESLIRAQGLLAEQQNITLGDKERLYGYLEGSGRIILTEPEAKLTKVRKMPGLDGRKMSKSYQNTISLRDSAKTISKKIKQMPTDPARIKLTDTGTPEKCPVWQWHQVYSSKEEQQQVYKDCKSAAVGCIDCKAPLATKINKQLKPIADKRAEYEDINLVKQIIHEGNQKAKAIAKQTIAEVRQVMGINY